jgi:hypothetical protein
MREIVTQIEEFRLVHKDQPQPTPKPTANRRLKLTKNPALPKTRTSRLVERVRMIAADPARRAGTRTVPEMDPVYLLR